MVMEDPGLSSFITCKDMIALLGDRRQQSAHEKPLSVGIGCSVTAGGSPQPASVCWVRPLELDGHKTH